MFDMGASDNSKIGTYEEFYMINNLWEGHPIHIHLINFQIISSYSLKRILGPEADQECTFYMLDYFRLSNIAKFQGKTND
jgi:FtsP/CotA-like multicopper oxidase with cupredoxin domain